VLDFLSSLTAPRKVAIMEHSSTGYHTESTAKAKLKGTHRSLPTYPVKERELELASLDFEAWVRSPVLSTASFPDSPSSSSRFPLPKSDPLPSFHHLGSEHQHMESQPSSSLSPNPFCPSVLLSTSLLHLRLLFFPYTVSHSTNAFL
jgi:hypothetical protein